MIKKIEKDTKTKRAKIIYTLKPKYFGKENICDKSFENLLKRLADMNHAKFVAENFGDND